MYIDYYNAVKTIVNQGLNSIKTVDWFNDQYSRYENLKAVALPAVYIEFPTTANWETGGNTLQTAEIEIMLHLVVFDVSDSPEVALIKAKELHKVMNQKVLMDADKQLSTRMVRSKSELVTNYDQLKVIKLSYITTVYDWSSAADETSTPVTLVLGQ